MEEQELQFQRVWLVNIRAFEEKYEVCPSGNTSQNFFHSSLKMNKLSFIGSVSCLSHSVNETSLVCNFKHLHIFLAYNAGFVIKLLRLILINHLTAEELI